MSEFFQIRDINKGLEETGYSNYKAVQPILNIEAEQRDDDYIHGKVDMNEFSYIRKLISSWMKLTIILWRL